LALKKVLIAYFPRPPLIDYLKRSFQKRGVEAHGFLSDTNNWFDEYVIHTLNKAAHNLRLLPKSRDLFSDHPLSHLQYRSRKFVERVREVSPDLVVVVRGWRFTADAMRDVRKGSKVFGWWIEREERVEEALSEAGLFDHYFFMNSSCVEAAVERGMENASLLHHSVDTSAFRPVECAKRLDWCFVGRFSPLRLEYVERALGVSKDGAVYGPGWLRKNPLNAGLRGVVKGDYIEGEALARLYSESRVVLNITNWGRGAERSGMNMRVLEVPACGACLLTDGSRDLGAVVTPGEHVVLFDGPDDFSAKLRYYLDNPDEREEIARKGCGHVTSHYTYDDVARIMIERYDALSL